MSSPMQQPGRPSAPGRGQIVPGRSAATIAPQQGGYRPQTTAPVAPQRGGIAPISWGYTTAPTLGQFWRSDVRRTRPGRAQVRWPGLVAFFGGLAAVIVLITGVAAASIAIVSVALAFSVVAGLFALIALVAGLGRVLGFLGLLLALAGNIYIVAPVFGLV
jgi:hypothetical protein